MIDKEIKYKYLGFLEAQIINLTDRYNELEKFHYHDTKQLMAWTLLVQIEALKAEIKKVENATIVNINEIR